MACEHCIVDLVDEGWIRFRELLGLVYDVLYRDFGVPEEGDWHPPNSAEGAIAVAFCDRRLAGTARLVYVAGDDRAQLRQLAIRPEFRRSGVGRALVRELEQQARQLGAVEIWLNARDSAYEFYERLGYEYTGGVFVSELTGIPHRPMRKVLGQVV